MVQGSSYSSPFLSDAGLILAITLQHNAVFITYERDELDSESHNIIKYKQKASGVCHSNEHYFNIVQQFQTFTLGNTAGEAV